MISDRWADKSDKSGIGINNDENQEEKHWWRDSGHSVMASLVCQLSCSASSPGEPHWCDLLLCRIVMVATMQCGVVIRNSAAPLSTFSCHVGPPSCLVNIAESCPYLSAWGGHQHKWQRGAGIQRGAPSDIEEKTHGADWHYQGPGCQQVCPNNRSRHYFSLLIHCSGLYLCTSVSEPDNRRSVKMRAGWQ